MTKLEQGGRQREIDLGWRWTKCKDDYCSVALSRSSIIGHVFSSISFALWIALHFPHYMFCMLVDMKKLASR